YDIILRYVPDAEREGVEPRASPSPSGSAGGSRESNMEIADPKAKPPKSKPPDSAPSGAAKPGASQPAEPSKIAEMDGGELTADKLRAAWEGPQKDEMIRITQALKAALPTATIEETGDVATMSYGSGGTVSLVREHGVWKIRDF